MISDSREELLKLIEEVQIINPKLSNAEFIRGTSGLLELITKILLRVK
jgi:hypothetical protein